MERIADLTHEAIARLKPIKAKGLYFLYEGKKMTPRSIYFSSDLRAWWNNPQEYAGRAYVHFDNALRPVCMPDGRQFEVSGLACVAASYRDGVISDFYKP